MNDIDEESFRDKSCITTFSLQLSLEIYEFKKLFAIFHIHLPTSLFGLTATRKRDVYCQVTENQTRLRSEEHCTNDTRKPLESEECYNKNCHGLWVTEPWSQVL